MSDLITRKQCSKFRRFLALTKRFFGLVLLVLKIARVNKKPTGLRPWVFKKISFKLKPISQLF